MYEHEYEMRVNECFLIVILSPVAQNEVPHLLK